MHSSSAARILCVALVASVAASAGGFALSPPAAVVGKLSSEDYPARVAAQKQLVEWAEAKGDPAKNWLLTQSRESKDPEVRRGSMVALKAVVVRELTRQRPGFVGVQMLAVEVMVDAVEEIGVQILAINPDTPAEKAGLLVNDVILSVNDEPWTEPKANDEFAGRIGKMKGGDKVRMEVLRDGKKFQIELELVSRPWSQGLYAERQQVRVGPFGLRSRGPLNEEERIDDAFQNWLEKQETGPRSR